MPFERTLHRLDQLHQPEMEQAERQDTVGASDGQAPVRSIQEALAHHELQISSIHFV